MTELESEPLRNMRQHAKGKAPNPQLSTQPARKRATASWLPKNRDLSRSRSPYFVSRYLDLDEASPSPASGEELDVDSGSYFDPYPDSDSNFDSVADVSERHEATGDEHRQLDGLRRECEVCMVYHKPSSFPIQDDLPADCSHCTNTCRACIGASLASAIENRPFDSVGCPRCKRSWDRYYIEMYSTKEVMVRYETLGMLRVVQAMPTFVWCLSPHCDSGQIHQDGDKAPIVTCAACGFKTCFTHQVAWHPEITCTEYEALQTAANADLRTRKAHEEEKTAAALARSTKPCPKCGVNTLKDGGCEHMTCKRCQYEYCWLCLAEYSPIRNNGNHYHNPRCTMYRHYRQSSVISLTTM